MSGIQSIRCHKCIQLAHKLYKPELLKIQQFLTRYIYHSIFFYRNHIHGEAAREACFQCGKLFATRQQVTKHMAVVHNANSENFTCDTCGANYTSKQGLQDHTASQHEGRAAHACHCGKEYRHATNLYRHKKSTKH